MEPVSRHHCLIYEGPPSRQLPALAAMVSQKLEQNSRCLYLNSPTMVAGMRSYLAAAGVDVAAESERRSLILSSELNLADGHRFDVQRMVGALREALAMALEDGYSGLWATGDMSWEFGPAKDFSMLLEYEWALEEFMHANPQMSGICQYRSDLLPREAMRHGVITHPTVFVNQTLSMINPQYLRPGQFARKPGESIKLDRYINKLISQEASN